jgi:hypothetical protein
MITAETVNGIVRFQANGLPVVSLYCRVDPGESQREVRARVDSLLDQIRPLASCCAPTGTTCWSPAGTSTSCRSSCGSCRTSCAAGWPGRLCGSHTRYTPDVLDELAAAVIGADGSARQIAADLMSEEYLAAAKLRFPPPPSDGGTLTDEGPLADS